MRDLMQFSCEFFQWHAQHWYSSNETNKPAHSASDSHAGIAMSIAVPSTRTSLGLGANSTQRPHGESAGWTASCAAQVLVYHPVVHRNNPEYTPRISCAPSLDIGYSVAFGFDSHHVRVEASNPCKIEFHQSRLNSQSQPALASKYQER